MFGSVAKWFNNALNTSSTPASQPGTPPPQRRVIANLDEATQHEIATKEPLASGYDGRLWRLDSGLVYKQSVSSESLDDILSEMIAYSLLEYVVNRFQCLGSYFKVFCNVEQYYIPDDVRKVHPELCALIDDPAPLFNNLNPRITHEHNTAPLSTLLLLAEPSSASELHTVRSYVDKYNMLIGNTQDVNPDIYDIESRISLHFGSEYLCAGFFMQPYLHGLENFFGSAKTTPVEPRPHLRDTVNLLTYLFQNLILLRLIHGAHLDFKPSNLLVVPSKPFPESLQLEKFPDPSRDAFRIADFSRFIFIRPYAFHGKPPICWDSGVESVDVDNVRGNLTFSSRAILADAVPAYTDDFESVLLLVFAFVAGSLIYEPHRVPGPDNNERLMLPLRKDLPVSFSGLLEDMITIRNDPAMMRPWLEKLNVGSDVIEALTCPISLQRGKLESLFWTLFDQFCVHGVVSIHQDEPHQEQTADENVAANTASAQPFTVETDVSVPKSAPVGRPRRITQSKQVRANVKPKRKFREEIIGLPRRNKTNVRMDVGTNTTITVLRKFSSYKNWDSVMCPWVGYLPAEGVTKRARKQPSRFDPYAKK